MPETVRVLTLNCWNVSAPFEERMQLVRAGIAALQPDLVGLQEIIVRRDGFDQGASILDGLGYHSVYGAAMRWNETAALLPWDADGDAFGNLIASRWPIRYSEIHALPGEESGERRSALAAVVESPEGLIPFFTTHLNWKYHHGPIRERQVFALDQFVAKLSRPIAIPPIIVGDLNAEPDSAEVRFLCGLQSMHGHGTYYQDAWRVSGDAGPGFTWDNRNAFAAYSFEPNRRIDYILVGLPDSNTGRGRVRHARVVFAESRDGVFASDHFGVLAEVQIGT